MTNDEVAQILAIIKIAYPSSTESVEKLDLWHALINDIPFADAKKALYYVLNTNKFEPKPADIRGAVSSIQTSNMPTAEQAWGEVLRKANIYANHIEWSHPFIAEAVRTIGLATICESETIGVERAHFFRAYENLAARKSQNSLLQKLGISCAGESKKIEGVQRGQIKH